MYTPLSPCDRPTREAYYYLKFKYPSCYFIIHTLICNQCMLQLLLLAEYGPGSKLVKIVLQGGSILSKLSLVHTAYYSVTGEF